jgi:tetraacyldisaccharide 4'-kinase
VFRARLALDAGAAARLRGERVVAFAGIARPEKFLRGLTEIGAKVVATRWFADHHLFSARDFAALEREARRLDARLATTSKDAARIGPRAAMGIETAPVDLVFERPEAIDALLARAGAGADYSVAGRGEFLAQSGNSNWSAAARGRR